MNIETEILDADKRFFTTSDRQFRMMPGKPRTVEGYAIVYNALSSERRGGVHVKLMPGSARFSKVVSATYHHQDDAVLGTTRNNSLRLYPDSQGVRIQLDLPDTTLGRDVAELVRRGDLQGASFTMLNPPDQDAYFTNEAGKKICNVRSFTANEICLTPTPAFEATIIEPKPGSETFDNGGEAINIDADEDRLEEIHRELRVQQAKFDIQLPPPTHDDDQTGDDMAKMNPGGNLAEETRRLESFSLPPENDAPEPEPTALDLNFTDSETYSREARKWIANRTKGRLLQKFATITGGADNIGVPKQLIFLDPNATGNAFRDAHLIWGVEPLKSDLAEKLSIPVLINGSVKGERLAENASSGNEKSPDLADSLLLDPQVFESGEFWFSLFALNASANLTQNIIPQLNYIRELALEAQIAADMIADSGITQSVTTSTTTAITYSNLMDLNRKLPRRYGRQKAIILSGEAFDAANGLVGDDGHPVLDWNGQGQARFNGTPVFECDGFEGFGASKTLGCVISLFGFRIQDVSVPQLARYEGPERTAQAMLNLTQAHGYDWAPAAVAKLKTPAS